MSRWWSRSTHDKVLIGTARAVLFVMLVCVCMLDSEQWGWFAMIGALCGAYLVVYTYANRDYKGDIV